MLAFKIDYLRVVAFIPKKLPEVGFDPWPIQVALRLFKKDPAKVRWKRQHQPLRGQSASHLGLQQKAEEKSRERYAYFHMWVLQHIVMKNDSSFDLDVEPPSLEQARLDFTEGEKLVKD